MYGYPEAHPDPTNNDYPTLQEQQSTLEVDGRPLEYPIVRELVRSVSLQLNKGLTNREISNGSGENHAIDVEHEQLTSNQ